jgi:hypothetical protein
VSAFSELALQCERRSWRVFLDGPYPDGRKQPGFQIGRLGVRNRDGEHLCAVPASAASLDQAAIEAARVLAARGVIT